MSTEWIKASTEKIDLWKATITVSKQVYFLLYKQKGRILKIINNKLIPIT